MKSLPFALDRVLATQGAANKPLGIVIAGHNGSGKSTMWRDHLSSRLQIPLINADRMMVSILPEADKRGFLPTWAGELRDTNESWQQLSRLGVETFVAQAIHQRVPFATETVFSDWEPREDGTVRSKIERIQEMQAAGYFVVLVFVGLSNLALSIARVMTRVAAGGHDVPIARLIRRFPKTQNAIKLALPIADAAVLVDNSLEKGRAFQVCRVQIGEEEIFDLREAEAEPAIREWLDFVAPRP